MNRISSKIVIYTFPKNAIAYLDKE